MATKATLLLLFLLLVSSTLALASSHRDRELEQCKRECSDQPHYDQGMRRRCEERCEEKQQEKERGRGDDEGLVINPDHRPGDTKRRLEQCKQDCSRRGQQEQRQCVQECQQRYEEDRKRERGRDDSQREDPQRRLEQCKQDCRESSQGQQEQRQCVQECQQRYEQERRREQGQDSQRQDPQRRFEQCKQDCRESRQGQQQQRQCVQQCQQRYEQERREQGQDSQGQQDPEHRLEQCKQDCRERRQGQGQQERQQCESRCQQRYEQERQEQGRDPMGREEEGRTGNNPYVFEQESFRHRVRSEHGNIRILQNFAQKSRLLLGIANYRLAILEANPNTFVVPNHFDADSLFYVVRGEGTIALIRGDHRDHDRESHNIRQGDIIKVSAGTVVYLINRSNNQRLQIAKILRPVSTPGQVQEFYTVGGEEPQSYYRVFSSEILEAALNTRRDQLDRLFGQQRQGAIIKASQEQIRSLSRHSSSSEHGHWPFGGGESSRGPFNLINKRPTHSNQHGRLHEADENDYQPLRDLNLQVSVINITAGSMMAPFYNSRATKIAIVTEGRGYFEMVCPHLSRQQEGSEEWEQQQEQEEGQQGRRYQKVRSQISRNTVLAIPPGHPVAIVADRQQNLEVVCFEVNTDHLRNSRAFLAGRYNIVNKMEREAKELAFGVPSKLVDEVFGRDNKDEVFVRGPQQQQQGEWERERKREEGGQRQPLESILQFAAGF